MNIPTVVLSVNQLSAIQILLINVITIDNCMYDWERWITVERPQLLMVLSLRNLMHFCRADSYPIQCFD